MDANLFSLNATLIQGATMKDLENMISRLLDEKLDEKLANVASPTIEVNKNLGGEGLHRPKETAGKLGISLVTLGKWTRQGIINSRKIGSRVYYTDGDINEALKNAFRG